jgi:hypothetical protein
MLRDMTQETPMTERKDNGSGSSGKDDKHESARQITEDALGAYAKGDDKKGDDLVEKAKQTDSSAVEEVLDDLEEDAGADHSVPKENR